MWTFNIDNKLLDGGIPKVFITFTNGVLKYERVFIPSSLTNLKQQINAELLNAEQNTSMLDSISKGVIDITIESIDI